MNKVTVEVLMRNKQSNREGINNTRAMHGPPYCIRGLYFMLPQNNFTKTAILFPSFSLFSETKDSFFIIYLFETEIIG